ncbi:MAG: hypothetical protein WC879_02290 [Melioribacteraceae bacterium]
MSKIYFLQTFKSNYAIKKYSFPMGMFSIGGFLGYKDLTPMVL